MSGLLALVLLALAAGLLAGLVVALARAPRATLGGLLAVAVIVSLAGARWLSGHRLGDLPDALQVRRILWAEEAAWGFGPGGNEAGFIAYALPPSTARAIATEGMAWFDRHAPAPGRDWRGRFSIWQPTPIAPDPRWPPDPADGRHRILDDVCRHGSCIDIDPGQRAAAEAALHLPASYYAIGRIGVVLVVPGTRRAYFFYNG